MYPTSLNVTLKKLAIVQRPTLGWQVWHHTRDDAASMLKGSTMQKDVFSWVMVMLIAVSLGAARCAASISIHSGDAVPMVGGAACVGALTALLYAVGRTYGMRMRVSHFLAGRWRIYVVSLLALGCYMLPGSAVENSSALEWGVDAAVLLVCAGLVAMALKRLWRA